MEHDGVNSSELSDHSTTEHHSVAAEAPAPVEKPQLRLPGIADVPLQFRLSAATCRVGLAGVAAAKRQLAEQAERRAAAEAARSHRRGGNTAADQRAA